MFHYHFQVAKSHPSLISMSPWYLYDWTKKVIRKFFHNVILTFWTYLYDITLIFFVAWVFITYDPWPEYVIPHSSIMSCEKERVPVCLQNFVLTRRPKQQFGPFEYETYFMTAGLARSPVLWPIPSLFLLSSKILMIQRTPSPIQDSTSIMWIGWFLYQLTLKSLD